MTISQFKESVFDGIETLPLHWRLGQKVFNYIDDTYHVARVVQYRYKIDCYYNDNNVDKFIEKTYEVLYNTPCKIFQVQKLSSDYGINVIAEYNLDLGTEITEVLDHIWHLCNSSCWSEFKKNDIIRDGGKVEIKPTAWFKGIANSDIFIQSYDNGGYYVCKPSGWEWELTFHGAVANLMSNESLFMIPKESKEILIQKSINL